MQVWSVHDKYKKESKKLEDHIISKCTLVTKSLKSTALNWIYE